VAACFRRRGGRDGAAEWGGEKERAAREDSTHLTGGEEGEERGEEKREERREG